MAENSERRRGRAKVDWNLLIGTSTWSIFMFFGTCGIVLVLKTAISFQLKSSHVSADDEDLKELYYSAALGLFVLGVTLIILFSIIFVMMISKFLSVTGRSAASRQSQPSNQNVTRVNKQQITMEIQQEGTTMLHKVRDWIMQSGGILKKVGSYCLKIMGRLFCLTMIFGSEFGFVETVERAMDVIQDIYKDISKGTFDVNDTALLLVMFIQCAFCIASTITFSILFIYEILSAYRGEEYSQASGASNVRGNSSVV